MTVLTEETEIDAPIGAVWRTIHDYRDRLAWDTMLRRVAVNGRNPHDAGDVTTGTVITQWSKWSAGGVMMAARYNQCVPPNNEGRAVAEVEMIRGPWFFRSFVAHAELIARLDGGTRCVAEYTFACRPRLFRAVIEPVVVWMFQRETTKRWQSLRGHLQKLFHNTQTHNVNHRHGALSAAGR